MCKFVVEFFKTDIGMKRNFEKNLAAAVPVIAAAAVPAALHAEAPADASRRAENRPNIIYIMTDQQCATAMSCAGNMDVLTPNMDRLAEHGIRFVNAYCAMPLSGPARGAMFTGYMPSETGIIENDIPIPDSLQNRTLGTLVGEAGYDCAYAGKWHVHTVDLPSEFAFGFRNLHGHTDIGLAEACIDYLREDHDSPFFLVASYINPHNICEFARNQNTPLARIPDFTLEDCPALPANYAVNPYDASVLQFEKRQSYALYPSQDFRPDDWRRYRYAYYRLVEAVDAEIGKIIDEIDRQNLWENTVIIFTSDHGDGCGAHQWNQKTVLYEEVANIPFIVCLPGGKNAGTVLPQLINNGVDLMPTVCDWAGAEVPEGRSGLSIRAVAESGDASLPLRDYVVTETNFNQTAGTLGWMVRTSKYKYVLYDKGQYREQLYDMDTDRGEMVNLAVDARYADIVKEHRAMLREWMETHPGPGRARHFRFIPE